MMDMLKKKKGKKKKANPAMEKPVDLMPADKPKKHKLKFGN